MSRPGHLGDPRVLARLPARRRGAPDVGDDDTVAELPTACLAEAFQSVVIPVAD
jgi:hypothetical protein